VQDGPGTSRMNVQIQVEGWSTYHALATTIDPFEPDECQVTAGQKRQGE
jgi:hypothetical protein